MLLRPSDYPHNTLTTLGWNSVIPGSCVLPVVSFNCRHTSLEPSDVLVSEISYRNTVTQNTAVGGSDRVIRLLLFEFTEEKFDFGRAKI